MKLIKIIRLAGVFSFAFSAAVGATESKHEENFYDLYHCPPNRKDFLIKIQAIAQSTEHDLSDKDKTLIKKIEKDPEAAGFSQQSKNDGVFDVLKNIATIRMFHRQLEHSREEEKKTDIHS